MPADHDERLRRVETTQATHAERLENHDHVLRSLDRHLEQLVQRLDKLQTRALIAFCIFMGGTENGRELIQLLTPLGS